MPTRVARVLDNNTRASGSGFFTWAIREGITNANPFANTNKAPQGDPRERTPTDAELGRNLAGLCPEGDSRHHVRLLDADRSAQDRDRRLSLVRSCLDQGTDHLAGGAHQRPPANTRFL